MAIIQLVMLLENKKKKHILRVHINTLFDLSTITYLVNKYKLNDQHPFGTYHQLLADIYGTKLEMVKIYRPENDFGKIIGLIFGRYGYEKNPEAAVTFNRSLPKLNKRVHSYKFQQ
jgi:hypothetical protein